MSEGGGSLVFANVEPLKSFASEDRRHEDGGGFRAFVRVGADDVGTALGLEVKGQLSIEPSATQRAWRLPIEPVPRRLRDKRHKVDNFNIVRDCAQVSRPLNPRFDSFPRPES